MGPMKRLTRVQFKVLSIFLFIIRTSLASTASSSAATIDEGCYELGDASDLKSPADSYKVSEMTPYRCVVMCAGTGNNKLAGLTNGKLCLCSDNVTAMSSICNQSCTGDTSLNCGGTIAVRMFNLSALYRNHPKLLFSSTPRFLEPVNYRALPANETTNHPYQLTYKVTEFLDDAETNLMFDQQYSYSPTAWGSDVELDVVVIGKVRQEFKKVIKVKAPMNVSYIKCPTYATVGSPIVCTGQLITGEQAVMTWSMDGLLGSTNLSDPVSWYIGDPVPRWKMSGSGADLANGLIISLTTGVTHSVIVFAWEMNVNKSGSLDIVVLRPTCGTGMTYCPTKKSCCQITSEFTAELCNQETSFCGTTTVCTSSENVSSSDVNNPVPLFSTYTPIYTTTLDVAVGYNIKVLPPNERFEYLPGDILGWIKSSSSATLVVGSNHGKYSVLGSVTSVPNDNITLQRENNHTGTVLLAGIASKPTEFIANISAPTSPGVKNISFIHKTSDENFALIRSLTALYPVGNVSFTMASNSCVMYERSNEAFNISIKFNAGTDAKVTWKLSNITVVSSPYLTIGNQDETNWQQNFTISSTGEYPLVVVVTNGVSGKVVTATVIIQEKITGVTANKADSNKTAYQGFSTRLNVSILTGTNVTYKWYFGDGSDAVTLTNTTLDHLYRKHGLINTTVEATNMVSSVNYSFIIDITNPVEITVPSYAVSNVSANITCRIVANLLSTYVIVLQVDNESLTSSNCNTIQHVFTPGDHDIHCYIHMVIVLYSNTSLFAVEPISGLSILGIRPLKLNANYTVEANISAGNNVSYEWITTGKTCCNPFIRHHGNPTPILFDEVGSINVKVIAFNAISNVSAETVVIVQEPIGELNITPSANPAKTDFDITFDINPTAQSGSINYTVNVTTVQYRFDGQPSSKFSHKFTEEGIYAVFVFANNLIDSSNATYLITVQVSVKQPPNITCPSVYLKEKRTCVISTEYLWSFKAEIPYATNVTFEWKWGEKDTTTDSSPLKNEFVSISSTRSKSFLHPRTFDITVKAKNKVSELIKTLRVDTLDSVTNFTFTCPRAVAVDTSFDIVSKIASGSNVTYSYVFGDGKVEIRNTSTNASWHYTDVAVYQIKGNASNLVSSSQFSHAIFVQQKIMNVSIEKIKTVATNTSASIKWKVAGGTNVTSNVFFGDGGKKVISYTECVVHDSNLVSTTCTEKYKWSNYGTYYVHIQAKNLVATKTSVPRQVIVQDPIGNLSVYVDPKFSSENKNKDRYYVNEDIPVICNVTKGTNITYEVYLGDDKVVNESEHKFNIKYYKPGEYTPRVKAFNDINSVTENMRNTIIVSQRPEPVPIKDLKLSAEPTRFNEKTKFEVEYSEGAMFKCSLYFGDSTKKKEIKDEDLKKGESHTYTKAANFTAKLECWNTEGAKNREVVETKVFVHKPIKGFKVTNPTLNVPYKESDVTINFKWVDGTHINVIAYTENKKTKRIHITNGLEGKLVLPKTFFLSPRQYIIRVNASNKVSSLDKPEEVTVNIIEEIKGAKVLFNEWVSVKYRLRAYLLVDEGSDMVVTWNFGDGTSSSITNCTWKKSCSHDHTYNRTGQFKITAKAKNELGVAENAGNIRIQYPIFGWKFRPVNISVAGTPSKVELVYNSSYGFPTDARYKIIFDKDLSDGYTKLSESIIREGTVREEHNYSKPGCYDVSAKMENDVSKVLLETTIKVRGAYEKVEITAQSLKGETESSQRVLPLEYPVKFQSNIENNCLRYNWTITKLGKLLTVNRSMSFQHTFNVSGKYRINLIAYDSEDIRDNFTAETNVTVDKSVTGLFLSSEGVGKANDSIQFILLWATLGDSTKFSVDYGDGENEALPPENRTKDFKSYRGKLPFDPAKLEGIIFSHKFSEIKQFKVSVKENGQFKLKTLVTVTEKPCPLPVITVIGGDEDANRAPQVPYETEYTIFSKVEWDSRSGCSDIKIDFEWRVFKADEYLLKTTGLSVIPPEKNREINYNKIELIRNRPTLVIPKKKLQPRLYIFQLNAKLQDKNVSSQYIVYVKIKRPPLIVGIEGGSARSVQWRKKFTLNANITIDPLTGDNKDLSFEWRCKLKDKQESGGCFGGGELLSARKGEKIPEFREKLLLEGITYEFTVKVSYGETSGEFTQEINAIPGKPPILKFSCVANCASKINPDARLSIRSKCEDNCEGLKYKWILEEASSSQTTADIWPNRTLTDNRSSSLVVKARTFQVNQTYIFRLDVENADEKTGFVSYKVETNAPPFGGECDFMPKNGSASIQRNFTCWNWTDDSPDAILSYKVLYSSCDTKTPSLLYYGPQSQFSGLRLPPAPEKCNHTYKLLINVEDAFKAFASKGFNVTVTPVNVSLVELQNASKDVSKLLDSGDIQAANRIAVIVVKGLSSSKKSGNKSEAKNEEKTKIIENIVKDISGNLPPDLNSMTQCIGTVVAAVGAQEDLPEDTQDEALDALLTVSQKLKSETEQDLSNDVIEETSLTVMEGLGNILKASSKTQSKVREKQDKNETVPEEDTKNIDENVEKVFKAATAVSGSILKKKVPNEKVVLLETENLKASLQRSDRDRMNGSSVKFSAESDAKIEFPDAFDLGSDLEIVDTVGLFLKNNPYQTLNTSKYVESSSVSLELKKEDGTVIKVEGLSEYLTIAIPRQVPDSDSKPENYTNTTSINKTETKPEGLVVHVLVTNSHNNALIVEIYPDDNMTNVTIYGRHDKAPTMEDSEFNYTFPANSSMIQHFFGNETINGMKYYVAVKSGVPMNYTFKSYELGCYYYDEVNKSWTSAGCTPSSNSTKKLVQCQCNHATLFGSNFFVAPNKLDVAKQIANFANLADYPALIATIAVIGGVYLIAMIWALRKDRSKSFKSTLHCAADNDPYDNHRYEVTLFTGSRRNAGSTAEPSIIITGDNGDSEPRLLQRTSPVSFKRTSQDSYLVTTAYSLGSLQYLRIWHDNTGPDPSWFLSEIIIRDVETGEQYFFLCNSWLACDEGDGLVERLVPVASQEELKDFQYLFMQNSTQGFSDGHLWFSIVLRPAQSRFTHAQRVTCCLCLLLCTMLVNAMFFRVPVAAENNVDVDVGPYQFTWHEVMVGIQSSLIVFPINLLIVTIFRRIGVRPTKSSKYLSGTSSAKPKKTQNIAISLVDIEMEKNRKKATNKNQGDQTPNVETLQPTARMRLLPWWFVFIAWFLLIITTITAGFFTILYGLQFGKRRQEQWLTALVISVFQDILVSQPIKIFALSLFVAFVIRKPNNVDVNEENDKLIQDEDWIQESLQKANPDGIVRTKTERKPPDELILRKMRLFRQKERKMFGVCREVLQFFFFWWIVLMIAYGHREPDAHRLSTAMEKTFTDLGNDSAEFHFKRGMLKHDIFMTKNKKDLLMWVKEVIIPGLYHEKWYNNATDKRHNFISDAAGYLIGSPRLRLLRIKKNSCDVDKKFKGKIDGCETEYSFSNEYQKEHNGMNWKPANSSAAGDMWTYKSQTDLYERPYLAELATYRGGGYVLQLSRKQDEAIKRIEAINKTWWIDGETRAVFVEFTLFYPGRNLHCIITIVFECPASGGCSASFQIQATRLDELIGNYRIFVLACELVFIVSIAVFTYKIVKDIIRQGAKFWYQFWNWIEMSIVAVGWTCLAFYIIRFIANKWTKSKFNDNPDSFVSFRYVATADQLYGIVVAFLVFLTSIKFLRLFRFNRRMSLLGSTLKYAAWDMFNFLILFAVAFIACVSIAYLLFQTNIDMFSSILGTAEALLNIILGKFKYVNLSHDTFVASAVVLAVYCVVVVFILMNVFLVILNDAFQVVKGNNDLQENEYEIVDYMTSRFKSWLGFHARPAPTVSDFEHEYGFKPTYVEPVKKKYQIPATAILDRKLEELLDFVEKQAYREDLENTCVDECEDEEAKKKALLLIMS